MIMKELSIEEKAKCYDEAIEKAKSKIKNDKDHVLYEDDVIEIFPELEESEDERIRKILIGWIHLEPTTSFCDSFDGFSKEQILAWLEKQSEMDMESYKAAEDEKREFVGDGFIKCYADFQDFKEGNTYWLEYIGNDKYNVKSDNLLGKTYHITPCQLYTIFKKMTWLEKQGEGIDYANKEYWRGYNEGKQEILDKYAELEKQDEQKPSEREENLMKCLQKANAEIGKIVEENFYLKEHKPANTVEPKFKVGDWVVNTITDNVEQIIEVTSNEYVCSGILIVSFDNQHLLKKWTIQDAKDGDVIYSRHNTESFEWIGIFKSLDKENKRVFFYGFWHNMAKTFSVCRNEAYVLYDDFSPATKEQRDFLFQKMKEAGYEWDDEKKELKKIEHKPAWSEEDEKKIDGLILIVKDWYNSQSKEEKEYYGDCGYINWLKSLKDRVQPKQEWSYNDEIIIGTIIQEIEKIPSEKFIDNAKNRCLDWLRYRTKSLRPQSTWKPSDEQMEALEHFVRSIGESGYASPYDNNTKLLYSLLSDLKKLK